LTQGPVELDSVWRRVLAVGAAAAVALALWVVVLVGFPSFPGGGAHLPALGPSSPRPSPSTLASPSPSPGDASNPTAQAGPPGSARLTGSGNGGDEVEDEPPDVEDEPPTASGGGPMAPNPTPAPAPGLIGQNLLPSAPLLPNQSLPALPLPTPPVP